MTKKELRKIYLEKRLALKPVQKDKMNDLILIRFQQLSLPPIHTLLSYWPMAGKNEIPTEPISGFLQFRHPGLRLAHPVSDFTTHAIKAIETNEDSVFISNERLIHEPKEGKEIPAIEIDAVLIPLLAFDRKGYRVGYGKGFYDRFLATCKKDIIKIGLSYFEPADNIEGVEATDIPMDYCITPDQIYIFHHV